MKKILLLSWFAGLMMVGCTPKGFIKTDYSKMVGLSTKELVYELGPPDQRYVDPDAGLVYEYRRSRVDDGGYFMGEYEPPTQQIVYLFFFIENERVVQVRRRIESQL